jgi:RecA/RadA recombinase
MSKLLKKFQATAKNIGASKTLPSYPTGFPGIDYRNGYVDGSGNLQLGFEGGKHVMVIGNSGCGKTTLIQQMAANIVDPYEDGVIIHLDYEGGVSPTRFRTVTGWSEEKTDEKYDHRNTGIYAETIYEVVKQMHEIKMSDYDKLKVETTLTDKAGNTVWELPPTIILVDSVPLVMPRKMDEKDQSDNNMRAAQAAKVIGTVAKQCTGPMKEANITIFWINHIQQRIETSAFSKKAADINYLKQDETLPGGRTLLYLQNYILRLDAGSKLKEDEEFHVKGFKVQATMIKSRTNVAGHGATLVFDQANGMNADLSSFATLKDMKKIDGAGVSLKLPNHEQKFAQKNFLERLNSIDGMREAFDELVHEEFGQWISQGPEWATEEIEEAEEEYEE